MPVIYSNNASTTLSAGINNSTTTIGIASASGFPSIGSGEYFFATIANTNNTKIEVVKVTAGTTSLTVVRAQDGTTAQAFDSGDNFQLRVTAATLEAATKTDVNITAGAISGSAISNDAIDSQHYADGSIDTAHIADDAVTAAKLANSINTDIATGVTANTTANAALPKSGGAMTGAITTNSTFDGRDVATDGTKLDGIEANATADQTDAEIRAAVEAATDSNVFTDADHSKLNGIEASADVTDATNVTAAGALMDSEVTNLAQVKAFASSDYATAAQGTTADAALPKAGGTMTGNTVHGDNVKDTYGTSSDLEIYHDGSQSYIKNSTGQLRIAADAMLFSNAAVSENVMFGAADGAVTLYHNGLAKLETDAAGINVTGGIDLTGNIFGVTTIGKDGGDTISFDDNIKTQFHINGNEEMRLLADGTLHVDGDVVAFSTTISDATLKYDINPIEHALDKVAQLTGVTYKYLKDGMESAGLLAQDVEKVMPCAVTERSLPLHTGNDEKYKTLNYDNLHALLIESIKELTAKVEKLENK